ncbi:MAG: methyl-accepting chemotaxis protein [Anaerolineae bacterium]|nr:methyl-accepting chemotaxis protein [Anaerolineae bacterium]
MTTSTYSLTANRKKISFVQSLGGKLMFFFLILAIVPTAIIGVLLFSQSQANIESIVKEELERTSMLNLDVFNDWLDDRIKDINTLAATERIRSMDSIKASDALKSFYKNFAIYETMAIIKPDGNSLIVIDDSNVNSSNDEILKKVINVSDRQYFAPAMKGETLISQPVLSKATGHLILVVVTPLKDGDTVKGIVLATVALEEIATQLELSRIGETGDVFLVNRDKLLVTKTRFEKDLLASGVIKERSELEVKSDTEAVNLALSGKDGTLEYRDFRGEPVIGAYHYVEKLDMALIAKQDIAEAFQEINALRNVALASGAVIIVLVVLVALWFSRTLSKPVVEMAAVAEDLAMGKIDRSVTHTGKDENGQLADSFRSTLAYMKKMAGYAEQLSDRDFRVQVDVASNEDVLGHAFKKMAASLSEALSEVQNNALTLRGAADQLALASNQAGMATSQIAATIQQVAKGITQQSEASSRTAGSVEQMTRAINQVAGGVREQTTSVDSVVKVTDNLATAIEQVAGNASAVTQGSQNASKAAEEGKMTVEETLRGLATIREKVNLSAARVQEMGNRSSQIGMIVETIEDIASQTNLLALNAAIEAARAGEHGKGFAVVADEVRKLAERSSQATREIAGLIKGIQQTVSEAVNAMQESAAEVENGVSRGSVAGEALEDILHSASTVQRQATEVSTAAEHMQSLYTRLVDATNQVAAVVQQTSAAADTMAAGSGEITTSMENIASVSEENSAAVEEISASTEEMTAQVEEVNASSQSLADLARDLQGIVSRFRLN